MMGRSHLLLGAAGFLAFETAAPGPWGILGDELSVAQLAAGSLVAAGAAMLPDLDHPSATLARSLGPVTTAASHFIHTIAGGHRRGTHTIWAWLGVSALAWWALSLPVGPTIALVFAILCSLFALQVLTEADGLACLLLAAVLGGACVLAAGPDNSWMAHAIFLGYGLHLLGDIVTTEGIPPFYPISWNLAIPILGSTDHWRERGAGALSGLVAFYLLVTTVFLPGWQTQVARAERDKDRRQSPALIAKRNKAQAKAKVKKLRQRHKQRHHDR